MIMLVPGGLGNVPVLIFVAGRRSKMDTPVVAALLTALGALIGNWVTNVLERWRTIRLRELEFRLDRYKEFLLASSEHSSRGTFETQLRLVDSINVINLIGSPDLLRAVADLVDNYNDKRYTIEKEQEILNRIMFRMRCDLDAAESKQLKTFQFPIIYPDITPPTEQEHRNPKRIP
jgi:hypothetical protein